MRKLLVLAIVLTLSLSLVWAADTIKDTQQTANKGKVTTQQAPGSQAVDPAPAGKLPIPAKVAEEATSINPNAIENAEATPEAGSPAKKTESEVKLHNATPLGDNIDKEAAAKEEDAANSMVFGINDTPAEDVPIITRANLYGPFNANGWGPLGNNPPAGWTIQDNATLNYTWNNNDWHKYYYSSWTDTVARVNYFANGNENQDDWLITPAVDFSTATACSLIYYLYYDDFSATDTFWVRGSSDGINYTDVLAFYAVDFGSSTEASSRVAIDISAFATGDAAYQVAFILRGPSTTNAYLDHVALWGDAVNLFNCDMNTWALYSAVGPCGMSIVDNQFKLWDANDWSKFYYSSWSDTVFDVFYNPRENMDEWLISQAFDFSAGFDTVELAFYRYYDDITGNTDTAWVYGSIDGGTTWPYTIATYVGADSGSSTKSTSLVTYNVQTWANLQANVKFAWRYKNVWSTTTGGAMYIDDIVVKVESYADDIAASGIVGWPAFLQTGVAANISGTFRNAGTTDQTFDGRLVINDGVSDVYDQTVTGISLVAGASGNTAFPAFTPATAASHTFTLTAINTGEENSSDNTYTTSRTVYLHQGIGGPDGGFYSWIDNTQGGGPAFSWVDMTAGTAVTWVGTPDDSYAYPVYPSAPFYFYGTMQSKVVMCTNGLVLFDSVGASPSPYFSNIPVAATPNNYIGFMRSDMYARVGGTSYLDDVANNRFVIQYDSLYFYNTPAQSFDCQIIMDRDDSTIVIQYNNFNGPIQTDAVIGIENSTGTAGLEYFYNATALAGFGNYPTNGLAVKFSYTAPAADVGVASFDGPNGLLYVGTPYTMSATVQNFTANAATFNVDFYADATLVGTVTGVSLAGFGTQAVSCPNTWAPATTGAHSLQVVTVYPGDSGPINDQITVARTALGAPVVAPFSTDLEANNGGFTGTNEWEYGTPTYASGPAAAHSGTNLWGTDLDNTYDASTWNILYFPPLDLSAMVGPELKFWMWHAFETNWDGANLKVSTDNGTTWTLIFGAPVYNDTASTSAVGVGGQAVYSGNANWTEVIFNLTPYAGTTILMKVDQGADGSGQFAGYYIDDISVAELPADDIGVTAILAPGAATIQGFTWQVAARVHNFGAGTQTNVPVHFEIYDVLDNLVYNQTYTLPTLEGGVDSTVIFAGWSPAEPDTHSFVSYTVLAGDIDTSNDTTFGSTYTYSHVGNGGPTEHYTFADNVNGGGPDIDWVDISTVGTSIFGANIDDGNSGFIPMGMTFKFFGVDYTQIAVCTNGWVSFTDAVSTDYTESVIPDADGPAGMVALLWDDMSTRTGNVYYYYDAIENQFIVQYDSVEFLSPSGADIGMEVIFDGDDNSIKMQYLYFALGSQTDVTVGIENATETAGLAYDNNGQVGQTPVAGVAITWTYTPPEVDVAFDHVIGQIGAAGTLPVCANFTNTGADDGIVNAHFEVLDAGNVVVFTGNGSGTVPAGNSADICAATSWTATPGTYTINVTATVTDDGNIANNDGSGTFIVTTAVASYPVFEDFENTATVFPPPGWTILHYGTSDEVNGTWQENTSVYRSPTTSAFQDDEPADAVKDEWLVMQPVDFTTAFQPIWKYYETGLFFGDYGIAHEFWVCTGPVFDRNSAVMVGQHLPNVHVVPTAWDLGDEFDLSAFVGQSAVWCAFRYQGAYSDDWYLDDVSINGPDMYDAQVDAVVASAEVVQPGDIVSLQVELSNNGYLPITATLTTVGVGTTSGEVYNDVTSGINIPGFGTTTVILPDYTTVPACGETYTFTSTVAAAGDTLAANNQGSVSVSSANVFQGDIVPGPYYYWPQVWYYLRKIVKPDEGSITHAVINFQDIQVPRSTFDFFIFDDSSDGGPSKNILYSVTNIQGQYPNNTLIDISSVYASLPDSFFFGIKNTNGIGDPYYRGPISDQGQSGGIGCYRARNDSLNWLAFPYMMDFSTIIDVRGPNFLDLTPTSITAPGSVIIGAGPFAVSGTVENVGTGDVTGGSAHMVITGTNGVDFDVTVPVDLTVGGTLPVNFGDWAPSTGGDTYTLTLTVSVTGEGEVCNNVITSSALAITGEVTVFEDFEGDNGGFVGTPVWEYGAPTFVGGPAAYSGANVWGTVLAGEYPINSCDSLRTPVFAAPDTGGAMVFYLWYASEYDWDGMNVKISVDGGPYTLVTPIGGYDLVEQGYLCDLMISMDYFTGASGGWLPKAVDLTPYAGQDVSFSFDFGSDGSVVDAGAYIDNFTIYDYYPQSGCAYVPGDINGNGAANGIDVSYGVNYFKGGAVPPIACDMCPQPAPFYAAGDVNASCTFNGIDITYFVSFLKGGAALQYCATCPPAGIVAAPAVVKPIGDAKVNKGSGN